MYKKKLTLFLVASALMILQVIFAGTVLAGERDVSGLTVAERNKLDIFFSNFSEVRLPDFTEGNLPLDALLNFGVEHVRMNTPGREMTSLDAHHWGVDVERVRASVDKYFGIKLAETDLRATTRYSLSNNGFYILPKADGEGVVFSQVISFEALDAGRYKAMLNVYRASPTFTGDVHADPSAWLLGDRQDMPHLIAVYNAEVVTTGLQEPSYYLVAYQKQK